MNLLDIFRPATAQPAPQGSAPIGVPATPATPQNPDPAAFQGTQNSPVVNTVASPLDSFKDLLKTVQDPNNASAVPSLNLDITKLQETVNGMDFGITPSPEQLAKLQQGDMGALTELLNKTAQAAFLRAAVANSTVSEQLTHKTIDYMGKQVPDVVRLQGVQSELAKNPAFNHEAASPFVQQLAQLIAQNSPGKSPTEIAESTQSFLDLLARKPEQSNTPNAQPQVDWDGFFKT